MLVGGMRQVQKKSHKQGDEAEENKAVKFRQSQSLIKSLPREAKVTGGYERPKIGKAELHTMYTSVFFWKNPEYHTHTHTHLYFYFNLFLYILKFQCPQSQHVGLLHSLALIIPLNVSLFV